mgnify:CR=1 FL=1
MSTPPSSAPPSPSPEPLSWAVLGPAARRPLAIAAARGRATMRVAPRLDDPAEEPWFDEPDADEAARDAALDAVARAWRLPPPRDDEADDELPVLDRSMFDLTNDSWFANLVRDDYYLAETIYAVAR